MASVPAPEDRPRAKEAWSEHESATAESRFSEATVVICHGRQQNPAILQTSRSQGLRSLAGEASVPDQIGLYLGTWFDCGLEGPRGEEVHAGIRYG